MGHEPSPHAVCLVRCCHRELAAVPTVRAKRRLVEGLLLGFHACPAGCQHVFNQADHHVFVLGVRLCHQQRQSGKAHVVDDGLTVAQQSIIACQEIYEQECPRSLIAIGEGVVFDDEI